MNQDLALRVLSQIMQWSDERARDEFEWLRLMARLKYDGYRDFQAGARFVERLAAWLQQFAMDERELAYTFLRNSLVYIGPREIERLVELFYPRTVHERLLNTASREVAIEPYRVFATPAATQAYSRLQRQTLFMGLSDGARVDTIRHENAGLLTNEQFVQGTQVDTDKWDDLLGSLREDLGDPQALFRLVYLIDDFVATGTSFLRYKPESAAWKGKLIRFRDSMRAQNERFPVVDSSWELCVHHYIASAAGAQALTASAAAAQSGIACDSWARDVHLSFGTILPEDLPIRSGGEGPTSKFVQLTQTYYDPVLRTRHTDVGGVHHLGLGYGGCALPVVLDHNTPNNSVALLWAETDGGERDGISGHEMVPLFRRRQRHA